MFGKRIYVDYASTTPLCSAAKKAVRKGERFANPSAIYREGVEAKKFLEEARARSARALEVRPQEIVFTSGGTESNNLAIAGAIEAKRSEGIPYEKIHVVTTPIEHSSVLECLRAYEKRGVKIDYASVNRNGIVSVESIRQKITADTVLVSVMCANNEIGTIQPVHEIGEMIRVYKKEKGMAPLFHTDACQAPLFLNVQPENLRADLVSLDGHKIYGPRGTGILFIKNGASINPILFGGGQEKGLRPTTENLSGIAGLSAALVSAVKNRQSYSLKMKKLRDAFVSEIEKKFPEAIVNGDRNKRLPNNVNVSFPWIADAEFAVISLDALGIACSTKSSCLKGEEESYVVKALDEKNPWRARTTLRFTFGEKNTRRDIIKIMKALGEVRKKMHYGSQ